MAPASGGYFVGGFEPMFGIPLGIEHARSVGQAQIRSSDDFEQILGERALSNLDPGLFGFFIPYTRGGKK